jgi:hypothetical protein
MFRVFEKIISEKLSKKKKKRKNREIHDGSWPC